MYGIGFKFLQSLSYKVCSPLLLKFVAIDNYAKDGGQVVVCPSCSFYHDPLRYFLFYLVRYKAHIHKLRSNSFSEPVRLISKPYDLK